MEYLMEKMSSPDLHIMNMYLLKAITEDFSDKMKIGSGGYGEVYKGVLNGDEIAVKKLYPVRGVNDKETEIEFRKLKKIVHKNLVRMIGFCYEIAHRPIEHEGTLVWSEVIDRVVCFEYMKGGSLANHISASSCIHDWPTTYRIIHGICEGLHYLHKVEHMTFHLDLKPDNVLLDKDLVPKIGDFGFYRLIGTSYTHQISTMKRTITFMPREYIHYCKVSPKTDVFSLGVIIFHMMAGANGYGDYLKSRRRMNFFKVPREFIESVQEYWKAKMQASKGYRWDETDLLGVTKCIEMATRCVEDDRDKRPSITEIMCKLKELDSKIEQMLKEDPKPPIDQLFYQDEPGESIILSKGNITTRLSSGHAEASSSTHSDNYLPAIEPLAMTFQELQHMTNQFSENRLLGKGGFGMVYKGVDNGKAIAVKKLHYQPGLDDEQFRNELLNLMRVRHQNIIRLVGYCSETQYRVVKYEGKVVFAEVQERALCLEYMQGGTLEDHLSDELCGLDWETRYKIIKGICHGLKYLHTGSEDPIYHLDLKPANVFLDTNRIPKIGDFGLSRLLASKETFVTQTNSGTIGYMPPEYMHGQKITSKFDVFSLGVIIIQIIAGRDSYCDYRCLYKSSQGFIDYVMGNWCKRKSEQAKPMSTKQLLEVKKCIELALRCVEDDHRKRPTITEIVQELMLLANMQQHL